VKRIYRKILRECEFSWRQLTPEQEARQVQRGRNLARHKPWEAGRIGKIENRVHTELICARGAISTGQLVRKIYCHERWDQNFRLREEGATPPHPKHWMYERVRLAAATFADRVGRGRNDGVYWRLRKGTYYHTIRAQKRERYRGRDLTMTKFPSR
jgi:hypothetical protein